MQQIRIGFSRPTSWFAPFSWIIRLVQWTPYSHVYVSFYSSKYERRLVYQASSLFVNFFGPKTFVKKELVVREFSLSISDETYKKFMQFAIDEAGDPYDILSIIGIGVVLLMGLFGKKISNPFGKRAGTFFCSKLVGDILIEIIGAHIAGDINTMLPKDIYNYLDSAQRES